ncbi:MAG: site-specific DNA-methyltransferase [Paludibacteraceae bacterium]|nr:site-specific DNA-methyltransferase [Paludibacteraceae bacterium]
MPVPTPYFQSQDKDFTLYLGDTVEVCGGLSDNSVDCIFADPPYFLSKGFKIRTKNGYIREFDKGEWDKIRSRAEVHEFNSNWIAACRRVLKPSGTIWVSGTYHNIFDVATCLQEQGFKILNIIVWQKSDPPTTFTDQRFNFSAEYIIWARREEKTAHYFNYDLMKTLNGGVHMPDVWKIPATGLWEKTQGKHPTQKPLRLIYRIILACTRAGDTVLDPFAGSCTTGIAANLLNRRFIGIDQSEEYLRLGIRRKQEISDPTTAGKLLNKMRENPQEITVLVNHAKTNTRQHMIETGICYLRAGESQGSLQVTQGFDNMLYVLLHTNGEEAQLFKLKRKGTFQIWTKETLQAHGFNPEHSVYYIVLHFDPTPIPFPRHPNLRQRINTYRAKIRPLSDFIGLI